MNHDNSHTQRLPVSNGWYALLLLTVIVGIEFAFESGSNGRTLALAGAVIVFGSIIAWRTIRPRRVES